MDGFIHEDREERQFVSQAKRGAGLSDGQTTEKTKSPSFLYQPGGQQWPPGTPFMRP
jgi:hypothetical protein